MARGLPIFKFTNEDGSEILTIDVDSMSYDSYGSVKSKTITITETANGQMFDDPLPISVSDTNEGSFQQIAEWAVEDNGSKTATIPDSLISSSTLYFNINGIISEAIPSELTTTTIQITCDTVGATIRYTLDGADPTETSNIYSAPIEVEPPITIKAKGYKEGWIESDVASYEVEASVPKLPAPETSRLSTGEVISRFYICLNNYSEYQLYTNPVIVVNKSDLGGNLNESFRCPLSSLILEDGKYYLNYENSKFTMFGGDRYFAYVTADGVEDSDIITL